MGRVFVKASRRAKAYTRTKKSPSGRLRDLKIRVKKILSNPNIRTNRRRHFNKKLVHLHTEVARRTGHVTF